MRMCSVQGLVSLGETGLHVQLQVKILQATDLPAETWERFDPFESEAPLGERSNILLHSKMDIRGTNLIIFYSLCIMNNCKADC